MIRHVVLLRLADPANEARLLAAFDELAAICAAMPGARGFTGGRSESPEKLERGFMHGFVADFADWQALAAYQADAEHRRIGDLFVSLAEGGLDGILVFDLEAP